MVSEKKGTGIYSVSKPVFIRHPKTPLSLFQTPTLLPNTPEI
jgi:hypothetical protein